MIGVSMVLPGGVETRIRCRSTPLGGQHLFWDRKEWRPTCIAAVSTQLTNCCGMGELPNRCGSIQLIQPVVGIAGTHLLGAAPWAVWWGSSTPCCPRCSIAGSHPMPAHLGCALAPVSMFWSWWRWGLCGGSTSLMMLGPARMAYIAFSTRSRASACYSFILGSRLDRGGDLLSF